jgi:hypothetical protein
MSADRWEYMKHRLRPDTSCAELNELGANGWRLCAVIGDQGIFTRNSVLATLSAHARAGDGDTVEAVREAVG